MSGENNGGVEFSTFADYDKVKGTLTNLYFIALNSVGEYVARPTINTQKIARQSLFNLALALQPKFKRIISDSEQLQYLSFFLSNPSEFHNLNEILATFALCQEVVEELGLTKIETPKISTWQTYTEVE